MSIDLDGIEGASPLGGPVSVLFGDVDGGAPDFAMVFVGTRTLTANDFIFGTGTGATAVDATGFIAAANSNSGQYMPYETQHMYG